MQALIVSLDDAVVETVKVCIAACIPEVVVNSESRTATEVYSRLAANQIDVVILDLGVTGKVEGDLLEKVVRAHPPQKVLVVVKPDQPDVLLAAMKSGIREVVTWPMATGSMREALERIACVAGKERENAGVVLAFTACKGGSGATFVATNVAYGLSEIVGSKVLLIDLKAHLGDAIFFVNSDCPHVTLGEICANIERIDGTFLDAAVSRITPKFGVLAGGDDDDRGGHVTPENIEALLSIAKQSYDFILLDVGRDIDSVSLRALDQAACVYPVLQMTVPDIRDASRFISTLRSLGYGSEKIAPVVNRFGDGGRVKMDDIERALGVRVVHIIPNDFESVSESINQGVPLLQLSSSSPVAVALSRMAKKIGKPTEVEDRGSMLEWIAGMFRIGARKRPC